MPCLSLDLPHLCPWRSLEYLESLPEQYNSTHVRLHFALVQKIARDTVGPVVEPNFHETHIETSEFVDLCGGVGLRPLLKIHTPDPSLLRSSFIPSQACCAAI